MYHIEFPVWHRNNIKIYHPAGSTEDLDEAIEIAKACYGRIVLKGNIIRSFELN
jgi:hypothetical protein